MLAAQESVFGGGRGPSVASSLAELESGDSEFWIAEVGDRVVCAGRLTPVEGTDFAGIWGGSTLTDLPLEPIVSGNITPCVSSGPNSRRSTWIAPGSRIL